MKKKTKGILIGGAILLAAAAVITGAVVGSVVTAKQKQENSKKLLEKNKNNNDNNTNKDKESENKETDSNNEKEQPSSKFEPYLSLIESDYNLLKIGVSNLNKSAFAGKKVKIKLVNTLVGSSQMFEQSYSIDKDNVDFLFNDLTDGSKYRVTIIFEEKEVISAEFETKLKPKISELSKTSTNAVLNLSDLNRLSPQELDKIEIVIKNKTDLNDQPITIKASQLDIIGGTARVDLAELDLGLEPGKTYEATIEYKKDDGTKESISNPLVLEIPQPSNVAFNYSSKSKPKEITIYGLKTNDKKLILEYKPSGTNVNYTSVTSKQNVTDGKVVIDFENDLGFDNVYEFKVKYEGENEFLDFENKTKNAEFKTEPAPKISVDTTNGLELKLDSISGNIDEKKLFIRYKDKESNEWKELLLSSVKDPETGKIQLPDLSANTEYETQLIYKTSDDADATPTILSVADFTTQKAFELLIDKSTVASTKVLVQFKDNLFSEKNIENGAYKSIKFKYVKSGSADQKEFKPLTQVNDSLHFAKVLVDNLEENTKYFWTLVDENETILFSGDFKTSKATTLAKKADNLNAYENNETEEVAVENRLNEGVFVLVKNNFGYFKGDGATKYSPEVIEIKYYPHGNESEAIIEKIIVTSNDLISKSVFSKQIESLDNDNYVFEISYKNGFDSNDELINVKKTFNVNYKMPEFVFTNETKKLVINNLDDLNTKNVSIKYSYENGAKTELNGQVENNTVTFNLKDLKPNSEYNVELEIKSEDVTFISSNENQKRQDFLGETTNSNLIVHSTFQTQEQSNVILVKNESISSLFNNADIKIALEGFKEKANKNIKVKIGTAEKLNEVNLNDASATDPEGVKSVDGAFSEEGAFETNDWIRGLAADSELKIRVYELNDESTTLTQIAERDYRSKAFEPAKIQTLEIIGSNTRNPSFRIPNLQALRDLLSENDQVFFRAQKITDDRPYQDYTNITDPVTFTRNGEDLGFGHLLFRKPDFSSWGNQGDAINLRSFINSDSKFETWFQDKQNYQIILSVEHDNKHYVVATTLRDKGILFNHNSPEIVEDQTTQSINVKQDNNKEYNASITFKLRNLADFTTEANPTNTLKGYFIKTDDILASSNPTNWKSMGDVAVENATSGTITFSGLDTNTNYNFAFLDKDNNQILLKERVRTISKPKLRNTTYGDTIMRYTLSDVKGAGTLLPDSTYTIKYSTDKSFSNSSNSIIIGGETNLANYEGSFVFTLDNNLLPNTTYNYKLVNSNGDTVLGYEGIFKTNESQSADKRVGSNYAVINLKNPSFALREGFYSIARKDPQNEGKMLLDVLKLEYSTTETFTPETTKEFSVSLSENESKLLPIRIENLNPNTKYYYRLVKGTISSNVIKNSISNNDNSSPEVNYETNNPVLLGSLTTLSLVNTGTTTNNSATLVFDKPASIQNNDELFLRYKRDDSSKEYLVEYNYTIENDKVIFSLNNLSSNSYFEYLLSGTDYTEYSRGEFSTKSTNDLNARLINFAEDLRRIEVNNADQYAGEKLRISYKEESQSQFNSTDVIITPENNKFLWDIDGLEEKKNYVYKVELLEKDNATKTIIEGRFDVGAKYNAGDQKVTTNVRTFGNYELNNWYTIATLQEIYANDKNWKEKVKESLTAIAIFGTQVSAGNGYAWHNLIHEDKQKEYFKEKGDGLEYSYFFNDNGKLKGVQFELKLLGNTIQVKINEARTKTDLVDPLLLVNQFNYSDLNEVIPYKATAGVINQGNGEIPGSRFLNISGFRFEAKRERISSKDFSIPQVFRYSMEAAAPALNELTPSINNNTVGAFIQLNNPKQKIKYGNLAEGEHNYSVVYNKYITKDNKLLPFNANFLVSTSSYPGFAQDNHEISVPSFDGWNKDLKDKFFRTLLASGKIRFTGSDTKNKNWISFNSEDILLFDDEQYAYSEKYLTEMSVKRIIWRDGNQLKGLKIALNDAKFGNGAVLGQFDDFVYFKEINANENLSNITWESFVEGAKKRTIHNYMNPNSPGSAIGGISFVSRDKMFINNNYRKYNNFSEANTSPKFVFESNAQETGTTRTLKLSNYELGSYKIKVEYLLYPGNLTSEQASNEQTIQITEDNKSLLLIDLTSKLQYNGKYKVSLLSNDNTVLNSTTGNNYETTEGVFVIPDPNNLNSGVANSTRFGSTSAHLYYNVDRMFGLESTEYSKWYEKTKESLKKALIGSNKFNDNNEVSHKWGKVVYYEDLSGYPRHPFFLIATLTDDNKKVIITELYLEPGGSNPNVIFSSLTGSKIYTLEDSDPKTLDAMERDWIIQKFKSPSATNLDLTRVLSSSNSDKKVAILGVYFENPRGVPPSTSSNSDVAPSENTRSSN